MCRPTSRPGRCSLVTALVASTVLVSLEVACVLSQQAGVERLESHIRGLLLGMTVLFGVSWLTARLRVQIESMFEARMTEVFNLGRSVERSRRAEPGHPGGAEVIDLLERDTASHRRRRRR